MIEKKTYVLSGNHYWQGKPAYIQMKEVINILGPVFWDKITGFMEWIWDAKQSEEINFKDIKLPSFEEIEGFLEDRLPTAMAHVLIPEGKTVRERDIDQTKEDLLYDDYEKMQEIFLDFLSLSGLLSRLNQLKKKFFSSEKKKPPGKKSTGKKSSSTSVKETSKG